MQFPGIISTIHERARHITDALDLRLAVLDFAETDTVRNDDVYRSAISNLLPWQEYRRDMRAPSYYADDFVIAMTGMYLNKDIKLYSTEKTKERPFTSA